MRENCVAAWRVLLPTVGYRSMGEGTASSGCGVWEALKCGGKRRRAVRGKRAKKGEVEPEEESGGREVKSEYVWETVGDAKRRNGILKKSEVGEESRRDEDGVMQREGDDDTEKGLVKVTVEKEKDINDTKSLESHGESILKIYV